MKNIFQIFENTIFYDLSENILYDEPTKLNIYLNIELYINNSNFYYEKPKSIDNKNNSFDYVAPELYNNKKTINLSKANIWSLGILIFQMIFHELPDINYEIKLKEDNSLHNLIKKMLQIIPEKRISIKKLNNDSLIKEINILYDKNITPELSIKIMFVGSTGVGNNSLANSFISNIPYLGDFAIMSVRINDKLISFNGLKIKLQVMNGPGQESFIYLNKILMKQVDIIILTYDITSKSSLNGLIDRYKSIKEYCEAKIYSVCVNKIDLVDSFDENREIEIKKFALENNLNCYYRTSCKTYEGIEDMFYDLVDKYLKISNFVPEGKEKNKIESNKKGKKGCVIF